MTTEKETRGTEIFRNLNKNVPEEFHAFNLSEWSPTPFMIDVKTLDREEEIKWFCNHYFGRESSPMHDSEGVWKQSSVTMCGWCWFGFSTPELMYRFLEQFPSGERPKE